MSEEPLEPSLRTLLELRELRWIFVGGKGGVGKTTTSCCLAIELAKARESVLLISTDPAHNLSDAFGQKFTKNPTAVNGFSNLSAMEIDPTIDVDDLPDIGGSEVPGMMADLVGSIPGIDEAMSFGELMRQVQTMHYSVIVFDTAPTGHTLRLLSFPSVLQKGIEKIMTLKSRFGGIFNQLKGLMPGMEEGAEDKLIGKIEAMQEIINKVNVQFQNPNLTTFVCVCIPEFLSVYETERLVQELAKYGIDTHCIVVNQMLFPGADSTCPLCQSRVRMQKKYIDQVEDLYEDFHVVKMPLLKNEVRGVDALRHFSTYLMSPYNPDASQMHH